VEQFKAFDNPNTMQRRKTDKIAEAMHPGAWQQDDLLLQLMR
jgi:hypothetical protein